MLDIDLIEARANAALRKVQGVELSIASILLAKDVTALVAEVRQLRAVVEASVKLYDVGGPFASRAYVEFRRWCESVAAYKRAQEDA